MSNCCREDDEVRQRVRNRLTRIKRFFLHLVVTIIACLALTLGINQFGLSRSLEPAIPILVLLYIAHAISLGYQETVSFIVQQEMGRVERSDDISIEEKPKRGQALVLGDDGELEEVLERPTHETRQRSI